MNNFNISSSDHFKLSFPLLPFHSTLSSSKELSMNVYGTIIPRLSFQIAEDRYQGWKLKRVEGGIEYDPFIIQFQVDEEFLNWKILYTWLTSINNNKDIVGMSLLDYEVDASLLILDDFGKKIMGVKYFGLFPYDLGEISLSHREGESNLECSCTFGYTRFELE